MLSPPVMYFLELSNLHSFLHFAACLFIRSVRDLTCVSRRDFHLAVSRCLSIYVDDHDVGHDDDGLVMMMMVMILCGTMVVLSTLGHISSHVTTMSLSVIVGFFVYIYVAFPPR